MACAGLHRGGHHCRGRNVSGCRLPGSRGQSHGGGRRTGAVGHGSGGWPSRAIHAAAPRRAPPRGRSCRRAGLSSASDRRHPGSGAKATRHLDQPEPANHRAVESRRGAGAFAGSAPGRRARASRRINAFCGGDRQIPDVPGHPVYRGGHDRRLRRDSGRSRATHKFGFCGCATSSGRLTHRRCAQSPRWQRRFGEGGQQRRWRVDRPVKSGGGATRRNVAGRCDRVPNREW